MNHGKQKAFFFDRDGIVNVRLIDKYVRSYEEFQFMPEFFELFRLIKKNSYLAILVTNQQGIGKAIMSEADLSEIHSRMQQDLRATTGCAFDDIYFAPDLRGSGSKRRKPESGMFIEAIEKWDIAPELSWTIGDSISDVIAGKNAGTQTILVSKSDAPIVADHIFTTLSDATNYIKKHVF